MTQAFKTKVLKVIGIDTDGWLISQYRGVRVLSLGIQHVLDLPGHPFDGMSLGNARAWIRVIDTWLDSRDIPLALQGCLQRAGATMPAAIAAQEGEAREQTRHSGAER